jgi:hypothetical protein
MFLLYLARMVDECLMLATERLKLRGAEPPLPDASDAP